MMIVVILFGRLVSYLSRIGNLGNGSTWPGHIALSLYPAIISDIIKRSDLQIVLIAGTNGKTTTTKLIQTILEKDGKSVIQNTSGANMLNGIASLLILNANLSGIIKEHVALFEIDENSLPDILSEITPTYIVLLNIFRDQLDRYGETDAIAKKWENALQKLPPTTTLVLNSDDPQIAFFGQQTKGKKTYFGLEDKTLNITTYQHAADTLYCPQCQKKLFFSITYFSHLGIWECHSCHLKRPVPTVTTANSSLLGIYNKYNVLAAISVTKLMGVSEKIRDEALQTFTPAFGRQETIVLDNKKIQLFLSKNPTSLNESLRTIQQLKGKNMLFVLNDQTPDGHDVSWIWDVDFERFLTPPQHVVTSGDRAFDMALRLKYARPHTDDIDAYTDLTIAIHHALEKTPPNETLYILPTYSALLEVRKILTGKKIL